MQPVPIHAGPFIAAVLIKFFIGFLWYSPAMFLRPWQRLSGISDEQMKGGMATGMVTWILGSVVMTFILAHAVYYAGARSALLGAVVGFMNWLGFVLVVAMDDWAAAKRPIALVAINAGSNLVALVLMGAVLGGWS